GTRPRSTLLSLAILRTSGEERERSPEATDAPVAAGATGAGAAGAGAVAGLPAPPPMTATTVWTLTVAPSGNLISVSVPAAGEGISASTLSVEISKSGSSRSTLSPTFLSHLVMVPSVMDSPICGMGTSVPAASVEAAVGAATGAAAGVAAGAVAGVVATGVGAALADGAATAPALSAMMHTTVLICTVAPSATLISCNVPAAGDGISASTLSVEISKSGSSRSTLSPTFLSHLVMVPSVIDSPICGITTSVGIGFLPELVGAANAVVRLWIIRLGTGSALPTERAAALNRCSRG